MSWTYKLNMICCDDKKAHVRMKDGEEFDCWPDCLTYDGDGNEEMTVQMMDGTLRSLPEDDIECVEEIA